MRTVGKRSTSSLVKVLPWRVISSTEIVSWPSIVRKPYRFAGAVLQASSKVNAHREKQIFMSRVMGYQNKKKSADIRYYFSVRKLISMKTNTARKFLDYLYGNFAGNFLGFVIGLASARLVSRFFATRSIKNLWGLTTSKTVVDKKTFNAMEWIISVVIGFIVFEIISKWVKRKVDQMLPKYKLTQWLAEPMENESPAYSEK